MSSINYAGVTLKELGVDHPPAPAVSAIDVTRRYGSDESAVQALTGVTVEVPVGQFVAVMGPSGSGKSTLMHILAGLDKPDSGSVEIGGREITSLDDRHLTVLRRREIGFVFQSFNLLPMLSAQENILLPLQLSRRPVETPWLATLVERVGLSDRLHHRPAQLSGGQQQRVAIARALITEPTVLFADEPTGNLDSRAGHEILRLLRDAALHGQTTVMVTHDPRAAAAADRVVFLSDGAVVEDLGGPSESDVLGTISELVR